MDINEVIDEIEYLEQAETTYQNCQKLATLYIIKDHLCHEKQIAEYSYSGSEFINAFNSAPRDKALEVLDEHMTAIKLLYPKEYSAILNRLKQ